MIFLDTSFLIALAMPNDALHTTARAWSGQITEPLLVTEHVLIEFVNAMSQPRHRARAHVIVAALSANLSVRHVSASAELYQRGLLLHAQRGDKHWSLTDCISFITMTDAGCREALTYDQHFEQAGFAALLRRMPG